MQYLQNVSKWKLTIYRSVTELTVVLLEHPRVHRARSQLVEGGEAWNTNCNMRYLRLSDRNMQKQSYLLK